MPAIQKLPKLTVAQLITHLKKDLGVKFKHVDEERAADFLKKNNYYYRLKCYMDDFERNRKGRFLNLDFGYLREISTIDMYLRKLLFKMSTDTEHYLKVHLVNECQENTPDDGYEVVQKFFQKFQDAKRSWLLTYPNYQGTVSDKRSPSVWAVLECLSFLEMTQFFEFYYEFFQTKSEFGNSLDAVRRIRNATAHNVCMLCSLSSVPDFKFNSQVCLKLLNIGHGLTKGDVTAAMKIPVLNDFAVLLDVYSRIISSKEVKQMTFKELQEFFVGRMVKRRTWFAESSKIKFAYKFALAVLNWYAAKA